MPSRVPTATPGVYTSTFDTGVVQFYRTLNTNSDAEYVLEMTITNCPYGWETWKVPGTARNG